MKKLLLFCLFSGPVLANELSLYVVPSPKGYDWSSPKGALISALKNKLSLSQHFMGHVWVELTCGERYELTGMTDENADYFTKIFIEQSGLGILYHTFPGRLEKKEDVQKEMDQFIKNGGINFIRFTLNEGQCRRALTYLDEYRNKNIGKNYGLAHRPLHGEGAGCSAFAVSFPDVLKILDQEMKEEWSETINIPLELAGPPLRDEGVSVFKIFSQGDQWAQHLDKQKKLTFWSPDKMSGWIKKKIAENRGDYTVADIGKISGVVFDKSHFPVPEEPIWRQQLHPEKPNEVLIIEEPVRPPKKR